MNHYNQRSKIRQNITLVCCFRILLHAIYGPKSFKQLASDFLDRTDSKHIKSNEHDSDHVPCYFVKKHSNNNIFLFDFCDVHWAYQVLITP